MSKANDIAICRTGENLFGAAGSKGLPPELLHFVDANDSNVRTRTSLQSPITVIIPHVIVHTPQFAFAGRWGRRSYKSWDMMPRKLWK
jgi:hypothetical protein